MPYSGISIQFLPEQIEGRYWDLWKVTTKAIFSKRCTVALDGLKKYIALAAERR